MAAKGIKCFGKVQGVFFRASTKNLADNLGVAGWVKNEDDGTVLIHAEGDESSLEELYKWCEAGPEFASVTEVKVWDKKEEGLRSFEIRRD